MCDANAFVNSHLNDYMKIQISPRKNLFFFSRSLHEQKFSNAKFRGETSARFRICFVYSYVSQRVFEIMRNFPTKFRADTPRHLRNVSRVILLNLNYFNVNYSVIWRMIANNELKVSHHIDIFHFLTVLLLRFTPIFPLPDEDMDCMTYSAKLKRCVSYHCQIVSDNVLWKTKLAIYVHGELCEF